MKEIKDDQSPEFEPCDVCGQTSANFDGFCPQCELPMDVKPLPAPRCVSCCGEAHEIIQWTDAGPRQYGAECSVCGRRIAEETPEKLVAEFKDVGKK